MKYLNAWWAWTSSGPKWRYGVGIGGPLLALLIVIGALSGDPEDEADATSAASTATVAAASTGTPAADPEALKEAVYRAAAATYMADFGEAMTSLGGLMGELGEEPTVLFDDSWRLRTAAQMVMAREATSKIRALNPPDCLSETHTLLVEGTVNTERGLDLISSGIDTLSAQTMTTGVGRIEEATSLILEAAAKAETACR